MITRQLELLKLLEQHGPLTMNELSAKLYASISTIRRDVIKLEKQKLLARSSAGVSLLNREKGGISLGYSLKSYEKEKKIIASLAVDLVQDKNTVFLASASATYFMIPMLAKKRDITIITNGLAHAQKAADCGLKSICLGGVVSSGGHSTGGLFAEYIISQLHADICFFSVPHVSHNGKLWHHSENTVELLRHMMSNSSSNVLLCNSQKIDDIAETYLLTTTDQIDIIVSDKPLSEDLPRKPDSISIIPEV